MRVPPAEIIDRMSILKLKIKNIGKPELEEEYKENEKALQEFKDEGIEIKDEWIDELYDINKEEWDLLEVMNEERKKGENFEKIGRLYIQTEMVNKKRSEAKNRIVEATGKGFKEIKKNHPSE